MKIFNLPTIALFSGAVAAATLLFWTSQSVQQKERQLAALQADTQKEEQTIRVLRTEWDYLNRPERLETLAHQYLGMDREKTDQIIPSSSELPSAAAPVVPKPKPSFFRQDASYRPAPAPPAPGKTSPSTSEDTSHSFQQLLKSLNDGGKAGQ